MAPPWKASRFAISYLCLIAAFWVPHSTSWARSAPASPSHLQSAIGSVLPKWPRQDDSVDSRPASDLALSPEGQRRADGLANFVEGARLEEEGEMDEALALYRKVLNVDPGQTQLAARVAALLTRQEDYPEAIDVLKDAIKASPKAAAPYLQLAFIYAKYLGKTRLPISRATSGSTTFTRRPVMQRRRSRRWIVPRKYGATMPPSGPGSESSMLRSW